MSQRVRYNDRDEIVPNASYFIASMRSMGFTSCKPEPTQSVAGCVKRKPDDDAGVDTHGWRLYRGIDGSLQYLSRDLSHVQLETNACAKDMQEPTKTFMDATETTCLLRGGDPEGQNGTHETWNGLRRT